MRSRQVYRVFDEEEFLAGRDLEIVTEMVRTAGVEPTTPLLPPSEVSGVRPSRIVARSAPFALLAASAGVAAIVMLESGRPALRSSAPAHIKHSSSLGARHSRRHTRFPEASRRARQRFAHRTAPVHVVVVYADHSSSHWTMAGPSAVVASYSRVSGPPHEFGFER